MDRMDGFLLTLQQLPQWLHIATGLLVTALMAAMVLIEDL